MKNILIVSGVILFIILIHSCKKEEVPTLTTSAITNIAGTSATSGGTITSEGSGTVISRGVSWSTSTTPTISDSKTTDGAGAGTFTSSISGLYGATTYYVRSYATNSAGTGYGNAISFTTQSSPIVFNPNLTYGTVNDIDANIYKTITIGTQVWMAENLKTIKYNDGTAIPNVTAGTAWAALTTPAYCWYNNDAANYKATYGALYNWYVVDVAGNGGKNVCPTSWHIPTDAEWTTLTDYLGGEGIAGGKLKETGLTHWIDPNTGATNETGFTALPGGRRNFGGPYEPAGSYGGIGGGGSWWSSTESSSAYTWLRFMFYYDTYVYRTNGDERSGFSVRCVRDL